MHVSVCPIDSKEFAEFGQLVDAFGIGWDRIRRLTINAMKSAFLPFDERVAFLDDVIRPAYLEHDQ